MARKAIQSIMDGNRQALMFIQAFFQMGIQNQGQSFKVGVRDKYQGIPFTLEINPNTVGSFLLYRVITSKGASLWQSWDSPADAENSFRAMSLI